MRIGRMIVGGLFALGLSTVIPSAVQAGERDRHFEHDRIEHRDFHEHVVVEHRDYPRHWERDHWVYGPAVVVAPPVVCATPVVVAPPIVVGSAYSTPISISDVPGVVLSAAARTSGNAPISSVDYIHDGNALWYDVHAVTPNGGIETMRFGINGGFWGWR